LYKSSSEINPGLKKISSLKLSCFSIVIANYYNYSLGIAL
jgi:hypothetical protein